VHGGRTERRERHRSGGLVEDPVGVVEGERAHEDRDAVLEAK
jgi:hypothetical protein